MTAMTLPALIQRFFTDRLCVQMEASRHTIASYRDTFRLLLRYAGARLGKPPVAITVEDIDVDLVADFLAHTEATRGNCARSRNNRTCRQPSRARIHSCRDKGCRTPAMGARLAHRAMA